MHCKSYYTRRDIMNKYYDDDGGLVFVSCGISDGSKWMTVRQKKPTSGTHRISSKKLPIRTTRDEAQTDLDAYAHAKRWDIAE